MGVQDPANTVELNRVTAGYLAGAPILSGASARLSGNGLLAVQGPNGSGKSTLFELLSGHLPPWSGTVTVGGSPPRNGRCRSIAVARTEPAFFPHVTMRDHCHLFARGAGVALAGLAAGIRDLDLGGSLDKYPEQLSSGTRKKFWFVLHIRQATPVLAFDEPFNAVDARSREWMSGQLLAAAERALVLLVSHEIPAGWRAGEPRPMFGEVSAAAIEPQPEMIRS
jgi:ABC-type multidrug transport system ATPase subunit